MAPGTGLLISEAEFIRGNDTGTSAFCTDQYQAERRRIGAGFRAKTERRAYFSRNPLAQRRPVTIRDNRDNRVSDQKRYISKFQHPGRIEKFCRWPPRKPLCGNPLPCP